MNDLENDKAFKVPEGANALSKHFDHFNGDFDTPEEFIRACLQNDPRALQLLTLKQIDALKDTLEKMSPEIQRGMQQRLHEKEGRPRPEQKKPEHEHGPEMPEPD